MQGRPRRRSRPRAPDVPAWVLLQPPPTEHAKRAGTTRERFVRGVAPSGDVEHTVHAIEARRFASASAARSWASRFSDVLDEHTVVRR